MGPLNNLNILSFQNNKEELVRSFHSLPIPPYIVFEGYLTFCNKYEMNGYKYDLCTRSTKKFNIIFTRKILINIQP